MEVLVAVLLAWISATAPLPPSQEAPQIVFVPGAELAGSRSALAGEAAPDRILHTGHAVDVHAFYDDAARTIYLANGWSARSPTDVSVLVHELTHHLQNVAGVDYACAAERERVAYEVQKRWLAAFGLTLTQALEIDEMTLLVRTRCLY